MTKLISTNPSSNFEVIGEVEITSESEIIEIVKKSKIAQKKWANFSLDEILNHLQKVYNKFNEKKDDLAILISKEMGMPITLARFEMESGLNYINWAINNAHKYLDPKITYETESEIQKIYYMPKGVVGIMIPWNFPMSIFTRQSIQSLIVGNSIVMKHSKETCLFGKEIEKIFLESGFPRDVFSEIYGGSEVADILVEQDLDMITFTGSTRVGKMLYKKAAEKFIPVVMELGGSAPGIVFDDVNVDDIIETIFAKRFFYSGQVCDGLKRLIVHESKYDEVVEKLKNLIKTKKVGNAMDEDTIIGPMVGNRQIETLEKQLDDAVQKGAKVEIGGHRITDLKGSYFAPTILTNISFDMQVWTTEVFGPVLPIVSFKTYEEAIVLANDTEYGLGGYVFTNDNDLYEKVAMDVNTGMICQNNLTYEMPTNPFGGTKKSGLGRENGEWGFHDVADIKIVSKQK